MPSSGLAVLGGIGFASVLYTASHIAHSFTCHVPEPSSLHVPHTTLPLPRKVALVTFLPRETNSASTDHHPSRLVTPPGSAGADVQRAVVPVRVLDRNTSAEPLPCLT